MILHVPWDLCGLLDVSWDLFFIEWDLFVSGKIDETISIRYWSEDVLQPGGYVCAGESIISFNFFYIALDSPCVVWDCLETKLYLQAGEGQSDETLVSFYTPLKQIGQSNQFGCS